jgi:uncharacterized protein DUF4129
MNLSKPSLAKRARAPAQEQFSFHWIEVLAVPVPASLMEAQPFVLALRFGSLLFTGQSDVFPLVEGSITLLVLSLYWWALLVRQVIQPRIGEQWANLLYLPGLFVTFAVIVGTHTAFAENIPQLVFAAALSTWIWRRGMARVEQGLQEEHLITALKVGFVVLLAMLFFAVVYPQPVSKMLLDALVYALPVFFLSGLVALSLSHFGAIKEEYTCRSSGGSRSDPTSMWLSLLPFLWAAIFLSTIGLAAFSFEPLVIVFSPLVDALRAFLSWLLSLFASQPPPTAHRRKVPHGGISIYLHPHPYHNPYSAILQLILVIVMVLLALFVLVMVFLLLMKILRKWGSARQSDEDEVRERLSVRSTLRARRKQRQRRPTFALEPLDATSARARYRALLQVMDRRGDDLGRRPEETPIEYQARLLTLVENTSHDAAKEDETPADAAILGELTGAYMLERYGGKATDPRQRAYLRTWVPHLVRRLMGSASKYQEGP